MLGALVEGAVEIEGVFWLCMCMCHQKTAGTSLSPPLSCGIMMIVGVLAVCSVSIVAIIGVGWVCEFDQYRGVNVLMCAP